MTSSFLALALTGIIVLMGMGILKKRKFKANLSFFGFNFGMESEA